MSLDKYRSLLSTDVSDAQKAGFAMDIGIRSVSTPTPAIMGVAYTVSCENRSNAYLHDAIYKAPKGSIVVTSTDACDYAVAGGNVCAVAQQNGIAGFIIDGVVRDLGEIRNISFPVFARGMFPKPGNKTRDGSATQAITCGGITINTGDLIVADEEGIVVIPQDDIETILEQALTKRDKAEAQSLEEWRSSHEKKIREIIDGE